jgi:hypothetical protein
VTTFVITITTPAAASDAQAARLLSRLKAVKAISQPAVACNDVSGAVTATWRTKRESVWQAVADAVGEFFVALAEAGIGSDAGAQVELAAAGHVTRLQIEHGSAS